MSFTWDEKRINGPAYNEFDGDRVCSWYDANDFEHCAAAGDYVKVAMNGQAYDRAKIINLDKDGMDLDVGTGLLFIKERILYDDVIDMELLG